MTVVVRRNHREHAGVEDVQCKWGGLRVVHWPSSFPLSTLHSVDLSGVESRTQDSTMVTKIRSKFRTVRAAAVIGLAFDEEPP